VVIADRVRDTVAGTAGLVHRKLIAPRRHDGPLPYVDCRPTTNPILPVADMQAAISFYERLGFEVTAYDERYAWVRHCGWEWLHLRLVDSIAGNEASAYLHVDDADAWRAAMHDTSAGEVELSPLEDMPWGQSEFFLTDPSGNLIRIGQPAVRR
jgi:catechol 2,3-dioxygenase-like lactoylglutathione lyase family enzyme